MKPSIPITDPRFEYTPASNTDLAKRFKAEIKRLKAQAEPKANVTVMRRAR